jgi:Flp pilus assembly protein TadG
MQQKSFWSRLRDRDQRAQAMVEFALVAPIFLTGLLGVFEMGRLMMEYTSMANAARESARTAAIATYQPTYVTGQALRFAIVAGPTPAVVATVTRNGTPVAGGLSSRASGDSVTISLSHTFQPMGFLADPAIPLSASAVMKVE